MNIDKALNPIWFEETQPGHFPSSFSPWVSLKPLGGQQFQEGLAWVWAGVSMAQHRPAWNYGMSPGWGGQIAEQGAKVKGLLWV